MLLTLVYSTFVTLGDIWAKFRGNSFFHRTISTVSLPYFIVDSAGSSKEYIVHHLAAALMMVGGSFSTCDLSTPVITYHMLCSLEYSTIFLNLYRMKRAKIYKYLFVATFLYFRTYRFSRWYFYEPWRSEVELICTDHIVYNNDVCNSIFIYGLFTINSLNVYWTTIILKKLVGHYLAVGWLIYYIFTNNSHIGTSLGSRLVTLGI